MGGRLPAADDRAAPDCNIMLDAIASHAVLSFAWPHLTILGLGVRGADRFPERLLRARLSSVAFAPVVHAVETWFDARSTDRIGTSDPMTAVLPFRPELFTDVTHRVDVDVIHADPGSAVGPPLTVTGALRYARDREAPDVELVASVEYPHFREHFFDLLTGPRRQR
jgi:inosine-uridine nucleoside N-ribohydrolase